MSFLRKAGLLETQVGLEKFLLQAGVPPRELAFTLKYYQTRDTADLQTSIDKLWSTVEKYGLSEEAANIFIQKYTEKANRFQRQFVKPFFEIHFTSRDQRELQSKVESAKDFLIIEEPNRFKKLMRNQPPDFLRFENEADAQDAKAILDKSFTGVTLK
jgi:hypothetical protein